MAIIREEISEIFVLNYQGCILSRRRSSGTSKKVCCIEWILSDYVVETTFNNKRTKKIKEGCDIGGNLISLGSYLNG